MTVLLLLWCLLAQGEPGLRLVSVKIYAPNQTVKPILIMLTVRNETAGVVEGAQALVRLTPLYRGGQRGKAPGAEREQSSTMLDPFDLQAPLPPLEPGQSRSLILETPYLARSAFSTTGRTFTVENLIPNLKRTVPIQVDVQLTAPVPVHSRV